MDTAVTDSRDLYVADFERAAKSLPGFPDLRRRAIERFAALGFPTGREEAWRFTDVTPLTEIAFKPAVGTANPNQFAGLANGALKALQITFVDGRFAPAFSSLDLPKGVSVTSLGENLKTAPTSELPDNPFAALNLAFHRDGAAIRIADGVQLDRPIHALFLSSLHGEPYVMHPRTTVSLGEGARAMVVNSFLGPSGGLEVPVTVTCRFVHVRTTATNQLPRGFGLQFVHKDGAAEHAFMQVFNSVAT